MAIPKEVARLRAVPTLLLREAKQHVSTGVRLVRGRPHKNPEAIQSIINAFAGGLLDIARYPTSDNFPIIRTNFDGAHHEFFDSTSS